MLRLETVRSSNSSDGRLLQKGVSGVWCEVVLHPPVCNPGRQAGYISRSGPFRMVPGSDRDDWCEGCALAVFHANCLGAQGSQHEDTVRVSFRELSCLRSHWKDLLEPAEAREVFLT